MSFPILHFSPPAALPATLSAGGAAATPWQCVVIGAGPAGSATALRLAAQGWRVLLIDRGSMPRKKVCGCCLSPVAYNELRLLESLLPAQHDTAERIPAMPLAGVSLAAAGRVARMSLPSGGVISRETLDTHLVQQAIAAGADWLPEVLITAISEAPCTGSTPSQPSRLTITIRLQHASAGATTLHLQAEMVVLATGLADGVRLPTTGDPAENPRRIVAAQSRVGIGATLPPEACDLPAGELLMAVAEQGYCGMVRLEDGRIDLAAAVDKRLLAQAGSPAAAAGAIVNQGCGPGDRRVPSAASLAAATFRATPALTHTASLVVGEAGRIFRVGDAAGYVEPFTGEGIGWALASARVLAAATSAPEHAAPLATAIIANRYGNLHRRLLGAHHARCRRVAWAVRRPGLVGGAVRLAQCFPWAAGHVVPGLIGAGWSAAGAQSPLLAEATPG
ncbi:MAG: FAD-dependent oxidoreductase [Planctomycetota bacterium]